MVMTFTRTDLVDGSSEELTIVEVEKLYYCEALGKSTPFLVLVTQGDHFAGVFDLDGDAVLSNLASWITRTKQIPANVPDDVITQIEEGWATGNFTIVRNAS